MFGGSLANPIMVLAKLLASCVDANGRVAASFTRLHWDEQEVVACAAKVAAELGIRPPLLYRWARLERLPKTDQNAAKAPRSMEQLEADHQPRDWPDDAHSSNTWGVLPPRSYFRFDEAAIESERESLEMQGIPLEVPA